MVVASGPAYKVGATEEVVVAEVRYGGAGDSVERVPFGTVRDATHYLFEVPRARWRTSPADGGPATLVERHLPRRLPLAAGAVRSSSRSWERFRVRERSASWHDAASLGPCDGSDIAQAADHLRVAGLDEGYQVGVVVEDAVRPMVVHLASLTVGSTEEGERRQDWMLRHGYSDGLSAPVRVAESRVVPRPDGTARLILFRDDHPPAPRRMEAVRTFAARTDALRWMDDVEADGVLLRPLDGPAPGAAAVRAIALSHVVTSVITELDVDGRAGARRRIASQGAPVQAPVGDVAPDGAAPAAIVERGALDRSLER